MRGDLAMVRHHGRDWRPAVGLAGLWWLVAAGEIDKLGGPTATLIALPTTILFAIGVASLPSLVWRGRASRALERYGIAVFPLTAVVAFVLVHWALQAHAFDTGLDDATAALLAGRNPYPDQALSGHPLVELPGAFVLATPIHLLGDAAFQNPIWMAIFLARMFGQGTEPRTAALRCLLVLSNPGLMRSYLSGSDYGTCAIIVLLATDVSYQAWTMRHGMARIGAALLLALGLCAHPVYWVALPAIALGTAGQRRLRHALYFGSAVATLVVALSLPFYFADPPDFGPLTLWTWAQTMPHLYWAFPGLGICCSVPMVLRWPGCDRVVAATAVALGLTIIPPLLLTMAAQRNADEAVLALPVLLLAAAGWLPVMRTAHSPAPHGAYRPLV